MLVAKESLGLTAQTTSLLLSLVGVMSVITQGLIVGWISKRVRETRLIFFSTLVLMFGLLGWGFASSVWQYILLIIPIAVTAGLFNVSLTSLLTKSTYKESVGGTLGLAQSQQTFSPDHYTPDRGTANPIFWRIRGRIDRSLFLGNFRAVGKKEPYKHAPTGWTMQ